jgi:hypothetical protein
MRKSCSASGVLAISRGWAMQASRPLHFRLERRRTEPQSGEVDAPGERSSKGVPSPPPRLGVCAFCHRDRRKVGLESDLTLSLNLTSCIFWSCQFWLKLLLARRVSLNDTKMSAQDLSCSAFVFILLPIIFCGQTWTGQTRRGENRCVTPSKCNPLAN